MSKHTIYGWCPECQKRECPVTAGMREPDPPGIILPVLRWLGKALSPGRQT